MDLNSDDYYGSPGLENVSNTVRSFIFPINSSLFVTRQLNGKGAWEGGGDPVDPEADEMK